MTATERQFPLRRRPGQKNADHLRQSIPWKMLAPHQQQALANHGQSLERLAERGGLSPGEACDVLLNRRWASTSESCADAVLESLVESQEKKP